MRKDSNFLQRGVSAIHEEDQSFHDDSHERSKNLAINPKEKIQRKLTCNNPQAPKVIVHYNYLNKNYEEDEQVSQHVMHFSLDGETISKESNYATYQNNIIEEREKEVSLNQIFILGGCARH